MAQSAEIERETLPEGWAEVSIGEVCEVNPPKAGAGELPGDAEVTFVPMPSVDADRGTIINPLIRPFAEVRKGFTSFREDDVIVAKITPCMENGKAAIARGLRNGLGFGSTEFHVLRPNGAVLPEYVYSYLRQESFRSAAEMEMTGSVGQKRVPAEFIRLARMPLPPLAEQARIVRRIVELTARVDTARERLAKVPAIIKAFRQAVLFAACSGLLTEKWREDEGNSITAAGMMDRFLGPAQRGFFGDNPKRQAPRGRSERIEPQNSSRSTSSVNGLDVNQLPDLPSSWGYYRADSVVERHTVISYGIVLPGPPLADGIPYIRGQDIENGVIHTEQLLRTTPEIASRHKRSMLAEGDVLLCIIRHLKVAIVPPGIDGANLTQGTVRMRPSEVVTGDYLAFFLRSPQAQAWMKARYFGMSMPRINVEDAREIPIPLAPVDEQFEIVRRIKALLELADAIERRVASATAHADKLTQSILGRAFRGELVPTEAELARQEGREYETASALLERLRAGDAVTTQGDLFPASPRRGRRKKA